MSIKSIKYCIVFVAMLLPGRSVFAQTYETMKDNGIKHKSFLFVGEWDTRHPDSQKMSVVTNGKVVWQYMISLRPSPNVIQEFDDVHMLPNGNIVYAEMSGAGIITPDKKIIWKFDCPKGTETHSCEPIGKDSVLMVLNGNPAKVLIINTATNQTLRVIVIPTISTNTHGQFRHVRWTADKTIMVGLMKEGKVKEFDLDGKELWSVDAQSPWSAMKLSNGDVLFSGDGAGYTREVDHSGKTVWELTQADVPFKLYNTQTANRLANGNTIICNWVGGDHNIAEWAGTVQAFEVTPDRWYGRFQPGTTLILVLAQLFNCLQKRVCLIRMIHKDKSRG